MDEITLKRLKVFLEHEANDTTKPIVISMAAACAAALEKQIPKKPIRDRLDKANLCPICNSSFTFWIGTQVFENKPYYCDACGQAIDWE